LSAAVVFDKNTKMFYTLQLVNVKILYCETYSQEKHMVVSFMLNVTIFHRLLAKHIEHYFLW